MGALSAFLTGVAGNGMVNLSQTMERRAEIERAQQQREAELQAQRDAIAQEKALDRASREGMLQDRLDSGALRAASSGGSRAGGGSAADPAAARNMAIDRLAAEKGLSRPEAEALLRDYETGTNRFEKTEDVAEQIDDGDRQRTVTRKQTTPDVEKFRSMMSTVAKHFSQAGAYVGAKPDDQAKAEQLRSQTGMAERAATDPGAAVGALAIAGKGQYDGNGTSLVTGKPADGSVASSQIVENQAQAGSARASAAKHMADANKIKSELGGDLRGASAEKLTTTLNSIVGLIRTYDDQSLDDATVAARSELQATARQIAAELQRRGLPAAGSPGKPPAGPAAPAAPTIDPAAALAQARQVLAKNPKARDEVLRRLKAAGIDAKGL